MSTQSETNSSMLTSSTISLALSPLETEYEDELRTARSPPHSSLTEESEQTTISMKKYNKMLREKDEQIAKMEQEIENLRKKYQDEKGKREEFESAIESVDAIIKNAMKKDKESSEEESNHGDQVAENEAKFEKWNEFPNEIKNHCIKSMDLKTRWFLRSTSQTERLLVDSQRCDLKSLCLDARSDASYEDIFDDLYPSSIELGLIEDGIESVLPIVEWILNTCNIRFMSFDTSLDKPSTDEKQKQLGKVMERIAKMEIVKKIRSKEVWISQLNNHAITFLKKLWTSVENVKMCFFDVDDIGESFETLETIPSIVNAKKLQFGGFDSFNMNANAVEFVPLIEPWFDDGEIGKKFELNDMIVDTIRPFISHFQDKMISGKGFIEDKYYKWRGRFNCNNPNKNILLRIEEQYTENEIQYYYLLLVVIPANIREDDYEKYTARELF